MRKEDYYLEIATIKLFQCVQKTSLKIRSFKPQNSTFNEYIVCAELFFLIFCHHLAENCKVGDPWSL